MYVWRSVIVVEHPSMMQRDVNFRKKPRDKSNGHFAHEYYSDVYLEC